jgi:hypothetical protein
MHDALVHAAFSTGVLIHCVTTCSTCHCKLGNNCSQGRHDKQARTRLQKHADECDDAVCSMQANPFNSYGLDACLRF